MSNQTESFREQVERVLQMSRDSGDTWDLSPNDQAALKAVCLRMSLLDAQAQKWNAEADRYLAQRDALLVALRKVRAHTSYGLPTPELLQGLLASIERIVDAALDGNADSEFDLMTHDRA